jgi:hypothetical protein
MGSLDKPPLARHPNHQEQVAVCAVALHYLHPNAGMKQYEYGRTQPCERGSGQQELAVETYRVKTKINNNHDIHKTQSFLPKTQENLLSVRLSRIRSC